MFGVVAAGIPHAARSFEVDVEVDLRRLGIGLHPWQSKMASDLGDGALIFSEIGVVEATLCASTVLLSFGGRGRRFSILRGALCA